MRSNTLTRVSNNPGAVQGHLPCNPHETGREGRIDFGGNGTHEGCPADGASQIHMDCEPMNAVTKGQPSPYSYTHA